MSIESLCTGDFVRFGQQLGGSYDNAILYPAADPEIECLIQEVDSSESKILAARGIQRGYEVFFSSDPGYSGQEHQYSIFWMNRGDGSKLQAGQLKTYPFGDALRLDIVGHYVEGRPGETLLWIYVCSTLQQNRDRS